jgi:hypothetical protein
MISSKSRRSKGNGERELREVDISYLSKLNFREDAFPF